MKSVLTQLVCLSLIYCLQACHTAPQPIQPLSQGPTAKDAPSKQGADKEDPARTPITISLQFPCSRIREDKLPTKVVYSRFREVGSTSWKALPVVRYESGKTSYSVETRLMEIGKTYVLEAGAAPGYYVISSEPNRLTSKDWVIKIKTKEYCY